MTNTVVDISQGAEKPSHDEHLARVELIRDLFVRGARRAELVRYVSTKTSWNVTPRTIDRYLRAAKRLVAREAGLRRELCLGFASEAFREIYSRALADKKYDQAIEAVCAFLKVHGINLEPSAGSGGTDDEQDRPIAILVGGPRLPNTPEGRTEWHRRVQWHQANPEPRIPALEASPLLQSKPKE